MTDLNKLIEVVEAGHLPTFPASDRALGEPFAVWADEAFTGSLDAALLAKDAEIARLRDALRPFAQEHAWGPNDRFEIVIAGQYGSITGSDLDRARAALKNRDG